MKYVAYYRVSTQKQGVSGLGLEAQKRDVELFVQNRGELIKSFTEVESGKKNQRQELSNAIHFAQAENATLVIAKLDRLSRNISFVTTLMEEKVRFICCDMPEATDLTIHIFAAIAQDERRRISERTKKALQSKKEQGFKLGKPENLTNEARSRGVATIKRNAEESRANRQATRLIMFYRQQGKSYREIANALNQDGFKTRYGRLYQPMTVKRLNDKAHQNELS